VDDQANRVADIITELTGRASDGDARARLAAWLKDMRHRDVVLRWLRYVTESDVDPALELALRTPIQDALDGIVRTGPIAGMTSVVRRHRRDGGQGG
jgi:hypothetical protein